MTGMCCAQNRFVSALISLVSRVARRAGLKKIYRQLLGGRVFDDQDQMYQSLVGIT